MSFVLLKSGNKKHRERDGDGLVNLNHVQRIRLAVDDNNDDGKFIVSFETQDGRRITTFDTEEDVRKFLTKILGNSLLNPDELGELIFYPNKNPAREELNKALDKLKEAITR